MTRWQAPEEGHTWMTEEILDLLKVIRGRHSGKKRTTIIKLAFARANQQPMKDVFDQPDVCAENIWYMKWRFDPAIKAAYEACCARALEWRDEQTALIEQHYRQVRLQQIARYAAQAPKALADVMTDKEVGGGHRISAADRLIQLADPEAARQVGPPTIAGEDDQVVNVFAGWSNEELDQVAANLEAAQGGGDAGQAEERGDA